MLVAKIQARKKGGPQPNKLWHGLITAEVMTEL